MNPENTKRTYRRKKYQELEFTDDFMFRKILRNNSKLCKELIELLLDVEVDHIHYIDDEHEITVSSDFKSIRVDVYLNDEKGTVFDLEMQAANEGNLPKRTRYYQSQIDIEHLESGDYYDDLPSSYIVFICMFDPFEAGMHKYEFRQLCVQDPTVELKDGAYKVFINALSDEKDMSDDMRAFLDYLCYHEAKSDLTRDIAASITQAKAYRPWRSEYMKLDDIIKMEKRDSYREGHEDGHAEGLSVGEDNMARLNLYLLEQGRADDLLRASTDKDYRASILVEMESNNA